MELQQLQTQAQQTQALFADTGEELLIVQDELVDLEPNKMVLEEALENAQASRHAAEEALIQFNEKIEREKFNIISSSKNYRVAMLKFKIP